MNDRISENTEVLVASSELNKQHGGSVPSESVIRKRLRKFKRLKRGYWSFVAILIAYVVSFFLPVLANNNAIIVKYEDKLYFPLLEVYQATQFGQSAIGEANYRALREQFAVKETSDWVFMPPYPYGPNESLLDEAGFPPHPPTKQHLFGTDDRGRDVFVRLAYGFHISVTFAILVTLVSYALGIVVGATLGYLGGKVDLLGQRTIEIWSSLPFLYTVIIVSSIIVPVYLPGRSQLLQPAFWLLAIILSAFGWMGITYYVRGEFYREKVKDYVGAALSMGASEPIIMFKHILPNSLTSVVSFAPFAIVANIGALVALDFLGFGLPAPTPSWGELIGQGMNNLTKWWLVLFPLAAVFVTLLLVVFIGEAIREAFDPKEFSRLR
ncbi:MAG TPA: peptide ABC transporter permease [Acidobacteria bacterium]|jgi:microcin C transport system permease protein|nr:peptide ABC transporter permease [Acidobacteriota bacterium]|tara:strand:- start:390 stop:1535 length:1146 start_codon:yes stop_codon:yes gene_type:complete